MSKEDNLFQPEQVYKQIELLGEAQSQHNPSADARLISNLRQVETEDREIVEQVWTKLAARVQANEQSLANQSQLYKPKNLSLLSKESPSMKTLSNTKRNKKTLIRLLELSAAILVIGALVGSMLVLLQKNRQQPGTAGKGITPTTIIAPGRTATPAPSQTPILEGCGTSYPATLTSLTRSNDPALFYMTGSGGYQAIPSATSLIRYDLVTGQKTTLVQPASGSGILDVELSPDKQWLLLRTYTDNSQIVQLQVMRTDGSMLQTVYKSCTGQLAITPSLWSPNGQDIIFPSSVTDLSVLNLTTGKLQTVLRGANAVAYQPAFWVNNQQLLIVQQNGSTNSSSHDVFLLDTSKAPNQQPSNLKLITSIPTFCGHLALSSDSSRLFNSSCAAANSNCQGQQPQGPSKISALPATGGPAQTIYSSQSLAITDIQTANASTLLLSIENTAGDSSQNGLWKINSDGSGLTRLTTTSAQGCQYSQYPYPLTQIASDGQHYALLAMNGGMQTLVSGELAGGTISAIVRQNIGNSNVLQLAGIGVY